MTEEEIKQLKISLAADQAMNALLASIGEPPDTSFMDDLKKRGIPLPDMTDYVPETVSDENFLERNYVRYERMKEEDRIMNERRVRSGEQPEDPIDVKLEKWGLTGLYKRPE